MRTFELNIFIDRPKTEVYNHLSEPINMIGLTPHMTSIDVLKEQRDSNGIVLRPFYTMQTFKWMGLPVRRDRLYWVIHLTKPTSELEFHVFQGKKTQIVFQYTFQESEEWRTHLVQRVRFEKVNKLLENRVFNEAINTQRALLTNLKIRLEKSE
jgi:uncharacterized membrane protein